MKIPAWLSSVWSFITGDRLRLVFQKIDAMVQTALPIVEEIAALTPTRTDDEIIRLFKKYELDARTWVVLPNEQRGAALMYAATKQLEKQYPTVPWNQLQSAAQLAVTVIKNR